MAPKQEQTAVETFASNARMVKLAIWAATVSPANAISRRALRQDFADQKHQQSHVQTVFWTLARLGLIAVASAAAVLMRFAPVALHAAAI